MKNILKFSAVLLAVAVIPCAQAITVSVDASVNSSEAGAGTGFNTGIVLANGQAFSSSASVLDLWNAGPIPRWSNADGLDGLLYATGSDESGQANGVLIGGDFGLYNNSGLAAHYGSLVGKIGAGNFFKLGTSFNGVANAAGTLELFYWDSLGSDNTESIRVTINVPDQGGLVLSVLGFGFLALFAKFKNRSRD